MVCFWSEYKTVSARAQQLRLLSIFHNNLAIIIIYATVAMRKFQACINVARFPDETTRKHPLIHIKSTDSLIR